jgi:hypothetical protein
VVFEGRWKAVWFCCSGVLVLWWNSTAAQRQGERVAEVPPSGAGVVMTNSACAKLGLWAELVNKIFAEVSSQWLLMKKEYEAYLGAVNW